MLLNCSFVIGESEVASHCREWKPVGHGIAELHMSIAVGIGACAGKRGREIQSAR